MIIFQFRNVNLGLFDSTLIKLWMQLKALPKELTITLGIHV